MSASTFYELFTNRNWKEYKRCVKEEYFPSSQYLEHIEQELSTLANN